MGRRLGMLVGPVPGSSEHSKCVGDRRYNLGVCPSLARNDPRSRYPDDAITCSRLDEIRDEWVRRAAPEGYDVPEVATTANPRLVSHYKTTVRQSARNT